MQDLAAERAFYDELFERSPENEHITAGYEELHQLAFPSVPHGRVLDLGCGTGAHAVRLARRGCRVVAVDLTRRGVRSAAERFRREGLNGGFVVADAQQLPFRNGMAEVTWTSLLLHHFGGLERLSAELARVTTRRLVAFEPNARNALTWFAFNVVNRVWGISGMTPNQRALTPRGLEQVFRPQGFAGNPQVHYVDRPWSDGMGFVRRAYRGVTWLFPLRFRANKFLVIFEKQAG